MRRLVAFGLSILLNSAALASPTLTVPEGFSIARVAGPPMVDRPICADFDDKGRLYVADSSGSNEKVEIQLKKKPHRIVRLEDTDADGVFDKQTVFADKMMFPEGILWHDGAIYCGAPPSIWKLEDTDDDGIADKRTEWFQGKTLTGCANDLHGPYLGPDGYIYWCKGAFAKQTHERPGRKPISDKAAHVFRCRPDGSDFDTFMAGGMDNPVEIAWNPEGDLFFTTTFYNHPRGGKRDAIVHAIYGGVYPKRHGVIDGLVRTGELMPAMTHLGPAAPCGLVRYNASAFGRDYRNNLFCCQFNTHKVTRHILKENGSTYRTIDSTFVSSDNPDFHPTDVLVDPRDGSLLVIDTGGWYKLCCPTSQIAKPEVLGAIYRVRPNERAPESIDTTEQQIAEIWAHCRAGTPQDRKAIRTALSHSSKQVTRAAAQAIGILRDNGALDEVIELLELASPHVRRVAATTLGHLRNKKAVPPLLHSARVADDRPVEHAIIHALVEINDPVQTREGLSSDEPRIQRVALIALDQMDGAEAPRDTLLACLESPYPILEETAWWIYTQRPERADELVDYLGKPTTDLKKLAQFASNEKVRPVIIQRFKRALGSNDETELKTALADLSKIGDNQQFAEELTSLAIDETQPDSIRLDALASLPAAANDKPGLFQFLVTALPDLRAATVLGKIARSREQLLSLTREVGKAGPIELPQLLGAFASGGDDELGGRLAEAVCANPTVASMDRKTLATAFANFAKRHLDTVLAKLDSTRPKDEAAHLDHIASELSKLESDPARGHLVFNSNEAACFTCHVIGYRGGDLGPGLSRIGSVRTERDLLEALLFPSASFVRSYESVTVKTKTARQLTGIVRDQNETSVTLAIGPGARQTIPRDEIASLDASTTSLMPAGLDQRISRQQLADLLAFLKSLR